MLKIKTKPMFRYFISISLVLLSFTGLAQQDSTAIKINKKDTIVHKEKYGLRIGLDLSKPLRAMLDDNYKGLELVGDFRISRSLYLAAELGSEEKFSEEDLYSFNTKGSYFKGGIDYNTYENWYGMQNIISAGMRIGVSSFSQDLKEYRIYNANQYWNEGDIPGVKSVGEYEGLSAIWAEFVLGLKAELLNNVYLGISARVNYLVSQKASEQFPNLYIPGFNKVTDDSKFGVGYNYTLTYFIPIFKKAKKQKDEKE